MKSGFLFLFRHFLLLAAAIFFLETTCNVNDDLDYFFGDEELSLLRCLLDLPTFFFLNVHTSCYKGIFIVICNTTQEKANPNKTVYLSKPEKMYYLNFNERAAPFLLFKRSYETTCCFVGFALCNIMARSCYITCHF